MDKARKDIFSAFINSHTKSDKKNELAFSSLFCDKKHETELKREMLSDWESIDDTVQSNVDLSPILHKLHFLINAENSLTNKVKKLNVAWNWYSRLAAIFLLPLITAFSIYLLSMHQQKDVFSQVEVMAPLGSRIHLQLPDGSTGWLNSGSSLQYTLPFEKRNVTVKGEAYFHVKADALHPFIVSGTKSSVKVLGTKFNVKMWPEDEFAEVVLEEGKVELYAYDLDNTYLMTPGDMLTYSSKTGKVKHQKVRAENYSAWTEGKLVLRGESMEQMALELSRWFNVEVEVEGVSKNENLFRATFEDEKLEDVLRLLKMTSPINYKIVDNKKDENGAYGKKRVIINFKE